MTMFVLSVRNTQRQYVRVSVPKGSEVWSATVDREPVKPAIDRDGHVMIPLTSVGKVGGGGGGGGNTSVSFAFLTQGEVMGDHGTIMVALPTCDLPISHLFVSLYLPEEFRFGEFETPLRQVRAFSATPPAASSVGGGGGGRVNAEQQMNRPVFRAKKKMAMKMEMDEDIGFVGGLQYEAGTSAVAVDLPTTNVIARFEQLLVMPSTELSQITVDFAKVSRGCCGRRRANACQRCFCCCCRPSSTSFTL